MASGAREAFLCEAPQKTQRAPGSTYQGWRGILASG